MNVFIKRCFFIFGFITAGLYQCNAAVVNTVTATGAAKDWSLASTWIGGVLPGAGDDVNINANVFINFSSPALGTITISQSKSLLVNISGVLNFANVIINGSLSNLTLNATGATLFGGNLTNNGTLSLTNFSGSTVSLGNVTNNGSISFGSSPASISLTGNFNNSTGVYSDLNLVSTIILAGSSQQTIFGPIDLNNLNVNNNASALIDATPSAFVNLNGVLTLVGTALFNAGSSGNFTVISNGIGAPSLGQATPSGGKIAELPTPANFTGSVTVQRFINGKTGGDYRYIAIPVKNAHADIFKPVTSIGITGNFSDPSTNTDFSNISNSGNKNPSIFSWNPAGAGAYVALDGAGGTVAGTPLTNRTGYVAYNFNNADAVIAATGPIEAGNGLLVTIGTGASSFSLVPNIYPCPIHWDKVYNDNQSAVNGSIWWRTSNGLFNPYVGQISPPGNPTDGNIAIGQSFWVKAPPGGGTGSLVFNEVHKTTIDATFVRKQEPTNYFWISLSSSTQKDYAGIRFHPSATDEEDNAWDAVKRRNGNYVSSLGQYTYLNLSTYTTSAAMDYAINSVAEIKGDSKTIGVIVKDVAPGDYTIGFEGLSKMQLGYTITLVDQLLNKETLVSEGTSYAFKVTDNPASYGDARFKVRFDTRVTGLPENAPAMTQIAYPNPTSNTVTLSLPKELDATITSVKLFDTLGNLLLTSDNDSSLLKQGEKSIDLSTFKSGVYILNITSGVQVKSIRLIRK